MLPSSGTIFEIISLFCGPGISLIRISANVVSKIERALIVPALLRMVSEKRIVSSSVEKSSLVYKTNLIVLAEVATGWGFSFLHDMIKDTTAKINKAPGNLFIFDFLQASTDRSFWWLPEPLISLITLI